MFQTPVVENIKTHFVYSNIFPKMVLYMDDVEKTVDPEGHR
jgi:hypothetical protein